MHAVRQDLLRLFTGLLGGDALAAEYTILSIMSNM
jgi:hypothetical protein